MKAAWALTDVHKVDLFILSLASAGAMIAGVLALGVGVLVAGPVVQLAWVAAYEELRKASGTGQVPVPA